MDKTAPGQGWLTHFRQTLRFLGPHRRSLIAGLLAAIGVSVFYTFSVSSIVPVLKIIFAEHETLVEWLYRAEAERRLQIVIPADLPDDPQGLLVRDVRASGESDAPLHVGDRLVALAGQPGSSHELARRIAHHPNTLLDNVRIISATGTERLVDLQIKPHTWWWSWATVIANRLPSGHAPDARFRTLLVVIGALVLIMLLGAAFRFANDGLLAIAVQRSMHDLRTALASHSLELPVAWHSVQPPGDTLARFANDVNKVEVGISTLFGKVVREPLKAVGVLSLTLLIDWHMLLIGLIGLPVGVLLIRVFGRLVKRAQRRASQSWGRLLDHLGERLNGIRVVKAFDMQGHESDRFGREDGELTRAQTHIELVDAGSRPALELLASLAISGFILYGGARVFNHQLEPHLFFGAVICLGGIFDPLRKMGNVYNRLQAADASAQRLFEVLSQPTEEAPAAEAAEPLPPLREQIEFRNVGFAYTSKPDQPVLTDVSLTVRKGQVVALVGPNGSGKTTLVSLLLRFFEPTSGQILIDGRNIAGVRLADLRTQIGLVTQEAVVFSDTVRANVAYGAADATEEQIRQAIRRAHVDDFVRDLRVTHNGRVTSGLDARISARTLSGGQRQRLALARAILRDPPILILDEATSQVDAESERRIQEALEDVTRDRTTFIIAHRFSTIARADMTVVLNAGQVVGSGRHQALLETCPFYETLVRTQFAQGVPAEPVARRTYYSDH